MFDMTPYEQYTFIICMVVYIVLTVLFLTLIVYILRLSVKLIRNGVDDDRILKLKVKTKKRTRGGLGETIEKVFTVLVCTAMFCMFGFSIYLQYVSDNVTKEIPTYRVVLSESMSKKYENNTYLFDNNLNDQFQRFDLVLTRALPAEEDLQLYDIVVYEVEKQLVIHRIVGIEDDLGGDGGQGALNGAVGAVTLARLGQRAVEDDGEAIGLGVGVLEGTGGKGGAHGVGGGGAHAHLVYGADGFHGMKPSFRWGFCSTLQYIIKWDKNQDSKGDFAKIRRPFEECLRQKSVFPLTSVLPPCMIWVAAHQDFFFFSKKKQISDMNRHQRVSI